MQQQPTADRYREIQQALTDRGYFAGPVDGNWGQSSTDALKRFQHDQNLPEDGKVGSLALIALGLGPKRESSPGAQGSSPGALPPAADGTTATAAPPPPTPQPSTQSPPAAPPPPPDSQPVPEAAPQ